MDNKKVVIPLIGGVILIIILGAGGIYFAVMNKNNATPIGSNAINTDTLVSSTSNSSAANSQGNSSLGNTSNTSSYKDGTYKVNANYYAPGGIAAMTVEVTLVDEKISSVTIGANASERESLRYQVSFKNSIVSRISGKTLEQAYQSGRVNGASLTTDAFNKALDLIISEAQV